MSTLIVIAKSPDFAATIASYQYRFTGRPIVEVEDLASFILDTKAFAMGKPRRMVAPKPGNVSSAPLALANGPISLLTIISHGEFEGPFIGSGKSDQLTRKKITDGLYVHLKAMRPCFTHDAHVEVGACVVGLNPWLLADLSVLWGGIRVTGFTTLQKAGMPMFTGGRVTLRGRTLVEAPAEVRERYRIEPPKGIWASLG